MEKIRCLFIDDQVKRIRDDISEWKKFSSDKLLELFNSFTFEYKQSDVKTDFSHLIDECKGYDFIVLDQMAVSDEAGTQLAEGVGAYLERENINYCIYTNQVGQETKGKFKKVNIYKKSEIVEEEFKKEHYCDGGFIDMLNHIKSNTGFNKYCRFLSFTNKDFSDLVRIQINPLMQNYLNLINKDQICDIDTDLLLNFIEGINKVLIDGNIIPDINYCNNPGGMIKYLITREPSKKYPHKGLVFLKTWYEDEQYIKGLGMRKTYNNCKDIFGQEDLEVDLKYIIKSVFDEIYLTRTFGKNKNGEEVEYYNIKQNVETSSFFFANLGIGDNLKNTLIGQALDLIWVYRCSKGHGIQNDPRNHALKAVYESILLVCERLSVIFERIDELKNKNLDIRD
jgi:hypothetical protein